MGFPLSADKMDSSGKECGNSPEIRQLRRASQMYKGWIFLWNTLFSKSKILLAVSKQFYDRRNVRSREGFKRGCDWVSNCADQFGLKDLLWVLWNPLQPVNTVLMEILKDWVRRRSLNSRKLSDTVYQGAFTVPVFSSATQTIFASTEQQRVYMFVF